MAKKRKRMRGVVQKIIKHNGQAEKAEISVHGADDLYRELRIKNETDDGAKLAEHEPLDVIIETDTDSKPPEKS